MNFESKLKRMNDAVSRCRTVEENGMLKTYIERPLADVLAESTSSPTLDAAQVGRAVEKYMARETTPVSDLPKISQVKANYKPAFGSARCGACAHYREHACELVEGKIEPNDVCDLFTPRREDLTARISEQYRQEIG